jgi:homotetrameric cytidine deaminase
MQHSSPTILSNLAALAERISERSYSPYSGIERGCVILLSDGAWVPGARVENASYPLLIPAAMNAVTTAVAAGRTDFVAALSNRPFSGADRDYLTAFLPDAEFDGPVAVSSHPLVPVGDCLEALLPDTASGTDDIIELTRRIALRALVPESDFPVGCILETTSGGLVPGCNVEHADWNLTLCAERNAIGTAVTYGLHPWKQLHVSCVKDPTGSPCGACRQVLVEHAPEMPLVMDRGDNIPEIRTGADLLPAYFAGASLRKPRT